MAIKIICRPNGPYLVENDGSIELYDAIGTKVDLTGKAKFALCRCGGSPPKTLCGRAHSKSGFQAAGGGGAQQKTRLPPREGWPLRAPPTSPRAGPPPLAPFPP